MSGQKGTVLQEMKSNPWRRQSYCKLKCPICSVVEYLQGGLGQPEGGFPEPLRSRVIKVKLRLFYLSWICTIMLAHCLLPKLQLPMLSCICIWSSPQINSIHQNRRECRTVISKFQLVRQTQEKSCLQTHWQRADCHATAGSA